MHPNIVFKEEDYKKAGKYLRLARNKRDHQELVTPDVIYKLSLMSLDKLTVSFLSFYDTLPEGLGTVALLYQVQKIVYIDDALIDVLANIIERHDQDVRNNRHSKGVDKLRAIFIAAYVREIYRVLEPYLPA